MIVLVLLGLMASSTTAWYNPYNYNKEYQDGMDRYWQNFKKQMNDLDKSIQNDGDEYKIAIYLTGFNKDDITVKVKNGNLVIQAINDLNSYSDIRTLPDFVDAHESFHPTWSYKKGILAIVFPIIQHGKDDVMKSRLPYVNNENEGDLDNIYHTDRLRTTSAPSQSVNDEENQPSDHDVEDIGDNKSLARECLEVHVSLLQWAGYMRRRCDSQYVSKAHALYRAFVLAMTTTYLLQEFVYAYQERSDMTKLSHVMFLLLCHITSIVKQIVFHVDADRIDQLIHSFDEDIYNRNSENGHMLLRRTTLVARRLEQTYAGCAVLTCTLWLVFPVMRRLSGSPVHFPFWTGLSTDSSVMFLAVLFYSYYVTTLVGIANTTMDAFIATILLQCKTQLRILRMDFQNLPERAKFESQKTSDSYENTLTKLFVKCFLHYRRVTETAALFEDIFGTAILVQFGIGGWILCMAAYKLVSLNTLSIEFAAMALFLMCILTELFLYCYYGNELKVESDRIICSVYSMQWVGSPHGFQRLLLILMERAKRPLRPAAGRVIPLSLDTFVKILKSSYTFYAVLRQTK